MVCKSCGSDFCEQLPLCPYCAAPRASGPPPDAEIVGSAKTDAETAGGTMSGYLGGLAVKVKEKAEAVSENLGELAVKTKENAGTVSENLGGLATKTKEKAEITGDALLAKINGVSYSVRDRFNKTGGFKGFADKFKILWFYIVKVSEFIAHCAVKLLLFIFKILKIIFMTVIQEFKDNYDSPRFWVYIGIIASLIIIIIIK